LLRETDRLSSDDEAPLSLSLISEKELDDREEDEKESLRLCACRRLSSSFFGVSLAAARPIELIAETKELRRMLLQRLVLLRLLARQ
jgi:hypothetical protein